MLESCRGDASSSSIRIISSPAHHHQFSSAATDHRHLPCLDGGRDGRRTVRARRQLHDNTLVLSPLVTTQRRSGKNVLTRCHRHGDVGIARQIQASQSRVRHFTPTYLGTVELHHHDSKRFKGNTNQVLSL